MTHRVLHVLDHSWPVVDGYSLRSRYIVAAQRHLGIEPLVLTGPLHRLDDPPNLPLDLDQVSYLRTPCGPWSSAAIRKGWPMIREVAVVSALCRRILDLLRKEKVDIVHAHSPALCGLAALRAARAARIPFVYEVRAFWEDAAVDQGKIHQGSPRYRLSRGIETFVARRADALVCIAHSMLEEFQQRGVAPEKLSCVPNGVDTDRFAPRARDRELAAHLGLGETPTLGFIGTFFPWEGLPWLVRAAAKLRQKGVRFNLLIVGDGEDVAAVRDAIQEVQASSYVFLTGRVAHGEIQRYYSILDVLVYPRRSVRLTELVTPLKPLEAMAQAKAVLASNVGGMRELIKPCKTGMLFDPASVEDFCEKAEAMLGSAERRRLLGEEARTEIQVERDWRVLAQRYETVYRMAAVQARARNGVPRASLPQT